MTRAGDSVPWSAALLGTVPVAALAGVDLARFLPLSEETRFVIGLCAIVPLWVFAICLTALCRRRVHAWLSCAGAGLVLATLAFAVPPSARTKRAAAPSYGSPASTPPGRAHNERTP